MIIFKFKKRKQLATEQAKERDAQSNEYQTVHAEHAKVLKPNRKKTNF